MVVIIVYAVLNRLCPRRYLSTILGPKILDRNQKKEKKWSLYMYNALNLSVFRELRQVVGLPSAVFHVKTSLHDTNAPAFHCESKPAPHVLWTI